MKFSAMPLLWASVLVPALGAIAAQAQEAAPLAQPAEHRVSPFEFAESGTKAEALETAAAAEGAGRVIGGEVAGEGAWPWQVALVVAGRPVSPDNHFCGGSLVLDDWVLTAAHCVHMADDTGRYRDLPPDRFAVVAGTNLLAPGQGDVIAVERVFVHPDYVGVDFDNDIALLKLTRAPQGVTYETITVPTVEYGEILDQPGIATVVTGWGLTNGGRHPEQMHQAEIQMMSRDMCNGAIMEARASQAAEGFIHAVRVFGLKDDDAESAWSALTALAPLPLSENMLCSGTFEGGRTSCQGDSGGPLVVQVEDGSFIQAGVVSWGLSAAETKTCLEDAPFSAYTKISRFVPWLEQVINQN